MEYNVLNKTALLIIVGLNNININAMEESGDVADVQKNQIVSSENNKKDNTQSQLTDIGWGTYLKQWYQGPLYTLMNHLQDPENININLNEPTGKSKAISSLLGGALSEVRCKMDASNFKDLVQLMQKSNITITDIQKKELFDCYELLIKNQGKTIVCLEEQIKNQNHEYKISYEYMQQRIVPLLERLKKQVDQYKNNFNKEEEHHKKVYSEIILPILQALAIISNASPNTSTMLNEKADEHCSIYCEAIGLYPQVPNQIKQLDDYASQLNELEKTITMPLISNLKE